MTGETYDNNEVKGFSDANEKTRGRDKEQKANLNQKIADYAAENGNGITPYASPETLSHCLGEDLIKTDYGKSWEVLFYFAVMDKMMTDYYKTNPSSALAFGDFGLGQGRELLFSNNINNSCAMVAAEIAMQYYNRIGIARFIPNDLSSLRLSYDFEYNDGNKKLLFSQQNKMRYEANGCIRN